MPGQVPSRRLFGSWRTSLRDCAADFRRYSDSEEQQSGLRPISELRMSSSFRFGKKPASKKIAKTGSSFSVFFMRSDGERNIDVTENNK